MEEKIFLITAGQGPLECCRVVYKVQELLVDQAHKLGLDVEVVNNVQAEKPGTFHSCTLKFQGQVPDDLVVEWQGTIQWIAQSPYRPAHKRKNWFIGVEILANTSKQSWELSDVTYETFRASGPGGQNVNKVESAVRIRHRSTGLVVQVMDSRSQLENKRIAFKRLVKKLENLQIEQASQLKRCVWTEHGSLERGNPVKVIRKAL